MSARYPRMHLPSAYEGHGRDEAPHRGQDKAFLPGKFLLQQLVHQLHTKSGVGKKLKTSSQTLSFFSSGPWNLTQGLIKAVKVSNHSPPVTWSICLLPGALVNLVW